jgi:hypothetical protein
MVVLLRRREMVTQFHTLRVFFLERTHMLSQAKSAQRVNPPIRRTSRGRPHYPERCPRKKTFWLRFRSICAAIKLRGSLDCQACNFRSEPLNHIAGAGCATPPQCESYGKEKEIHVILDNLNTHKPKNDRWLKSHSNVHLHFTPTHTSWLNQIEGMRNSRSPSYLNARRDAPENAPFQFKQDTSKSQPKILYVD